MISLPTSHINPLTLERETLVDISSVSIKSAHGGQNYDVEWMFNGTILILDAVELHKPTLNAPAELNSDVQLGVSKSELNLKRKRRFIGSVNKSHYNYYLRKIIETEKSSSMDASASNWNDNQKEENIFDLNDYALADLPANRTIHFNCSGSEQEFCLHGRFSTANFKANDSPILITLNFTINLKNVSKIMTEKKDFLVVQTSIEVTKTSDENE